MAANAAAAKWPLVVAALLAEHEGSAHYPGPAPRGTPLHSKLLAAAAGAISDGQFADAQVPAGRGGQLLGSGACLAREGRCQCGAWPKFSSAVQGLHF
jgi:hypothetical protein